MEDLYLVSWKRIVEINICPGQRGRNFVEAPLFASSASDYVGKH